MVAVLGKLDDVARRTPSGWKEDGQAIYLLGTTAAELDGSEWSNCADTSVACRRRSIWPPNANSAKS